MDIHQIECPHCPRNRLIKFIDVVDHLKKKHKVNQSKKENFLHLFIPNSTVPNNTHDVLVTDSTNNNATTNTSSYSNKREALCPSIVLLDLKATKDLDPEAVSR